MIGYQHLLSSYSSFDDDCFTNLKIIVNQYMLSRNNIQFPSKLLVQQLINLVIPTLMSEVDDTLSTLPEGRQLYQLEDVLNFFDSTIDSIMEEGGLAQMLKIQQSMRAKLQQVIDSVLVENEELNQTNNLIIEFYDKYFHHGFLAENLSRTLSISQQQVMQDSVDQVQRMMRQLKMIRHSIKQLEQIAREKSQRKKEKITLSSKKRQKGKLLRNSNNRKNDQSTPVKNKKTKIIKEKKGAKIQSEYGLTPNLYKNPKNKFEKKKERSKSKSKQDNFIKIKKPTQNEPSPRNKSSTKKILGTKARTLQQGQKHLHKGQSIQARSQRKKLIKQ